MKNAVYILTIDGEVWGAYSSMKKAEFAMEQLLSENNTSEYYIATRRVE